MREIKERGISEGECKICDRRNENGDNVFSQLREIK